MASCPHSSRLGSLAPPRLSQAVHREECTQCFDTQDLPQGVDICLSCFNGGCINEDRHHALTHFEKSTHPFVLNIKRKAKPRPQRNDEEPPLKKLAILEESEEDKYVHETTLKCLACGGLELSDATNDPKVKALVDGVMSSMSSARQSEVKAWEEDLTACEHALFLDQSQAKQIPAAGLAQCNKCDLKENMWLCLTCGHLGCGRAQYGGIGGNGHGLAHFNESGHPVSVKLGTITAEGTADAYCYQCNDSVVDPDLVRHLESFGINIATQTKTEKSMTELQIEQNMKFEFSMTGEDGKALQPIFGPGLTGLRNLGNSCYMASVLQALFSIEEFQKRYYPTAQGHWLTCTQLDPSQCIDCQMHKIADGLLSGRYSHPRTSPDQGSLPAFPAETQGTDMQVQFQEGIKPTSFKALAGKGHEEFSTMRQQDADEFFGWLLKTLREHAKKNQTAQGDTEEPTEIVKFGMEQRLQCQECKKVRYRVDSHDTASVPLPANKKPQSEWKEEEKEEYYPMELLTCLELLASPEELEYKCPSCGKNVSAVKQLRFSTFPKILVVHVKKFQLVNWVPQKLDIPVILPPNDLLTLDRFAGKGLQEGEVKLPDDSAPSPALPAFNEVALAQLQGMGFGLIPCQKALLATGNSDPEEAMNWLFQHMEDPDLNDPIVQSTSSARPEPSPEQISLVVDMGFTPAQARKALRETGGDMERAVEWLFSNPEDPGEESAPSPASQGGAPNPGGSSTLPAQYRLKAFINHKGPSVHSGHYVAHIRHGDEWVLFNDEKVVRSDDESLGKLKPLAYLYIFERV